MSELEFNQAKLSIHHSNLMSNLDMLKSQLNDPINECIKPFITGQVSEAKKHLESFEFNFNLKSHRS